MAAVRHARVVVTRRLPTATLSALNARPNTIVSVWDSDGPMPRETLLEECRKDGGAAGVLCMLSDKIDGQVIDACGANLKAVSTLSVGYNHVDAAACAAKGVRIGYTPEVLTEATADLAVTLLLSTARRVPEATAAVKSGEWSSWTPFWMTGKAVGGSTVGIVGLGRIGSAVARRLKGFGCRIQYTGRSGPKPDFEAEVGASYASLEDLLATSDFVVLLCALTPETRGLMSYDRLRSMKEDAVLVNVSRGEVVDQDALIRVLRERPTFRAGLDVTTPEPLPTDSPLLSLSNAVVFPHIGSATETCRRAMCEVAARNLAAGLDGGKMVHEVPETRRLGRAGPAAGAGATA
jgi:lactate dehydrogenase-like 2-hydroxyacid dehydrogenase